MNHFNEPPNVAVLTTKNILDKKADILLVFHDEDDGMWQFLEDGDIDENDASIVGLNEMIENDHSILEIADLPIGWVAWRKNKKDKWTLQPYQ
ncbi:MAG: hypothetical protein ACC608_00600 [Anaerofustis sp.]